jgi:hypothetical protein
MRPTRVTFQIPVTLAEACAIDEICISRNIERLDFLQALIRAGLETELAKHPQIWELYELAQMPRGRGRQRGKIYRFQPDLKENPK